MATGFLVTSLSSKIIKVKDVVSDHLLKTLYIYISLKKTPNNFAINQMVCRKVTDLYSSTAQLFPNLDVRIILNEIKAKKFENVQMNNYKVDLIILPDSLNDVDISAFTQGNQDLPVVVMEDDDAEDTIKSSNTSPEINIFDNVILGGTFDRLHAGHKILLSEALLRCQKKITVGVSDTCMLKSKNLWELIEPCERRINAVERFIKEVDSTVEFEVVPITDIYGPTKSDPTLNLIIVSAETKVGGIKVNELREKKGLKPLEMHVIDLVPEEKQTNEEESKISSSNIRMRLLGTYIQSPLPKPELQQKPYMIGLTGGIASGKSSISKYLAQLGAGIIDCDKIAHDIYKAGTKTFSDVVALFGNDIIAENGEINRKALGQIVFNDKAKLSMLNELLWPAILDKSLAESERLYKEEKKEIVVIEAAVLLQAGWYNNVHEVWTSIIPRNEAVKRLVERNGLSEEQAISRLDAQPTNVEQVAIANIVFSTMWSYEFTVKQVHRAWALLRDAQGFRT